ncbi:response regulator transcription factor [Paenibacillus alkalitolerans]|uniref:response regulator transcription factor n=1 Tax=Paenibacillus alkalitolerans TaxID=2799335 RepID=UPI0018F3A1FB|nr:response regulator [Paenibacillus alkalitolerans]
MHTVLIADDEPWVVYRIREMIEWERLGYTVIAEAHNGLSALETILEKKPDVVISDIRMPGLNGIELLEQIRLHDLRSNVILISGYSEFEYAQKALRFGAFDYLLKQVDKDKLTDALERLKETLAEKQKAQKAQKGLELLLDDLFEIFESDENTKLQNFLTSRGIECDYPHFRFISCLHQHSSFAGERQPAVSGIRYLRFRTGQNKVSFLINYDELKNPAGLLDFISDHLSDARCIGISGIGVYSAPVAKLYQESDIALCSFFTRPESRIIEYKPAADHASVLMGTILQIEVAVKEQKPEQVNRLLDELSAECKERSMQIDQLCALYNQIVLLFYKYYSSTDTNYEIEYLNYDQIFRQYRSFDELFEKLKAIFRQQTGEELHISNEMAKKIIEYIDSSFTEDIMLVDVAKKFNITVGYVSALMKKETGKTYMEYVMNKRLNLAKELLQDTSLSIQEIVERVGYRDYFHFNKIFKKYFGITPGKFRKL